MTIINKGYIENYLDTHTVEQNMHFIGRALVVLFNRQTEEEKSASDTRVDNGIGFTGADGHSGCITAKYYLKHRTLQEWQLDKWLKKNVRGTRRISKYWRQLNEEAERKARKASNPARKPEPIDADAIEARDAFREHPVARAEREMKDMFAKHEAEQERKAHMSKWNMDKYVGLPRETAFRRMIRDNADPRSL